MSFCYSLNNGLIFFQKTVTITEDGQIVIDVNPIEVYEVILVFEEPLLKDQQPIPSNYVINVGVHVCSNYTGNANHITIKQQNIITYCAF